MMRDEKGRFAGKPNILGGKQDEQQGTKIVSQKGETVSDVQKPVTIISKRIK